MAGPLSGIGAGQQIPISKSVVSPQQTNENQQVRPAEDEREPRSNEVQNKQAATVLSSETNNEDVASRTRDEVVESSSAAGSSSSQRGSLVDITV